MYAGVCVRMSFLEMLVVLWYESFFLNACLFLVFYADFRVLMRALGHAECFLALHVGFGRASGSF